MNQRPDPGQVTEVLERVGRGDREASQELLPLVYDELRRLAHRRMARERPGQTLQPTALVHEAYLRLVGDRDVAWNSRGHFFGAAAEAMRRILIERARRQARVKHGGDRQRVTLDERRLGVDVDPDTLLALDGALRRLERIEPRLSRIVCLRYFAGLTIEETARTLGVSPTTVKDDWAFARAWLYDELGSAGDR